MIQARESFAKQETVCPSGSYSFRPLKSSSQEPGCMSTEGVLGESAKASLEMRDRLMHHGCRDHD